MKNIYKYHFIHTNTMKYYESHYEEYLQAFDIYNLHPELETIKFPESIHQLQNMIVYGPGGCGKYTQVLNIIRSYSPSGLKYDKKILAQTDKLDYTYRISDVHYEVDMSLLGCNSKTLWHEIFLQIVDIISIKPDKTGIILCKNFHAIHNELLEVFYSYIQHAKTTRNNIHIPFILLTEHISFIPNNILNCCSRLSITRPDKSKYVEMAKYVCPPPEITDQNVNADTFISTIKGTIHNRNPSNPQIRQIQKITSEIDTNYLMNTKEIRMFHMASSPNKLPKDIFNIICDNIINEMKNHKTLSFLEFRDSLYDILTYNLDITDCIWYILHYFIHEKYLENVQMSEVLTKIYVFLKYYNNNYRPIYHLESIFFYLLLTIYDYPKF
jgi:hypothetical protein